MVIDKGTIILYSNFFNSIMLRNTEINDLLST